MSNTPTRLSDKTNKVYLCRWNGKAIVPLYADEKFAWDLSSLSLRQSKIVSVEYSKEIRDAVDALKQERRFKYDTLFLVFPADKLVLTGKNQRGKRVEVKYDEKCGLCIDDDTTD